jgi:hypothetical protein
LITRFEVLGSLINPLQAVKNMSDSAEKPKKNLTDRINRMYKIKIGRLRQQDGTGY